MTLRSVDDTWAKFRTWQCNFEAELEFAFEAGRAFERHFAKKESA